MKHRICSLVLLTLLSHCRAETDFESDLQGLGLLFGLSDVEGCAESQFSAAGNYSARLWAIPSRLCTPETRSGNSYTDYLELARKELYLMTAVAGKYETASCTDEVSTFRSYPADSVLTGPTGWGFVRDASEYPNTRWYQISDYVNEGRGYLINTAGFSEYQVDTVRTTTYADYISVAAGIYVYQISTDTADTVCQSETLDLLAAFHPGWFALSTGDSNSGSRIVVASVCYYGSAGMNPEARCRTLNSEFNG